MSKQDYRETLYTINSKGDRNWVYPQIVPGFFRKSRNLVAFALLLIYCSLPWISVDGLQAVHLDIVHRRFTFFGNTFWATDTKFLFLVLASLGISLFFFTSLFGRVWCGWACPQTVFLEFLFRPIERLIEGSHAARQKLDRGPWNKNKISRKIIKYLVYVAISWFLANTFLAYFIGREPLLQMMTEAPSNNLSVFIASIFMMGVVLFEFGWFREQFCTVLCPYARFQSVLLDEHSLIVGYNSKRGEPRGKAGQVTGDCIDCGMCVRVCPTGIDIRNGLQLECIHCASCIDACNSVMAKLERPLGLIKYATEESLKTDVVNFLRPRTYLYACVLLLLGSTFLYQLTNRTFSEASIFHAKTQELYQQSSPGILRNQLEVHLENKTREVLDFKITLLEPKEANLVVPINPFPVPSESFQNVPLFISFPEKLLIKGKKNALVEITNTKGLKKRLEVTLLGPG